MQKILGGIVIIMFLVSFPLAHADRFSEWLVIWKKTEELKAKEYQKKVLNFDYEKIQNKDKGFKTGVPTKDIQKKHIQNEIRVNYKTVK